METNLKCFKKSNGLAFIIVDIDHREIKFREADRLAVKVLPVAEFNEQFELNKKLKGMLVDVYRTATSDCTNGGVSSNNNTFILVGPGVPQIHEVDEDSDAVLYLHERKIGGETYLSCRSNKVHLGFNGPMMGGNFIYSSDSRFPTGKPIPIHDRYEATR